MDGAVNCKVLELTIAGWVTCAASILYYAVVRLDNLGRCVDAAVEMGAGGPCSMGGFKTGRLLLGCN